jgi:hypothetical protein
VAIQNTITAPLFRCDEDGFTVVYPNAVMGAGYVVPDDAAEQEIRRSLMWLVHGCSAIGAIGTLAMMALYGELSEWPAAAWAIAIALFVALNIAYRLGVNCLMRGMEKADLRMDPIDALKRQAEALPVWCLWLTLLMASLVAPGSVFWVIYNPSVVYGAIAFIGIAVFGVGAIQAIHGLVDHLRHT